MRSVCAGFEPFFEKRPFYVELACSPRVSVDSPQAFQTHACRSAGNLSRVTPPLTQKDRLAPAQHIPSVDKVEDGWLDIFKSDFLIVTWMRFFS